MPLFRACACYKNVFCSLSSPLPREHCRVRCPRKNGDGGRRVSDRAPATGMQDKKLQHGAPPVGDARGYLPRRSRGTRPYRASFFGDFGTRCTSFAVRGLRKVFLRRCHQRSIVRVCSPAVLRSCPAPSSTTFRLPRQRVSSSSTIRQTKCGGGPRPPLFGGSASPRERPSSSTPPGNVSSPRCARCQRGPRRPAASSKRRPGINRRAICFFFFFYLCCPRTVPCIAFMCVECARGDSDKVSLPVPSFVLRSCVASLLQPKHAWRSDREQLSIVSSRLQTAAQDHLKTFRQTSVRRFAPRFQLLARCESCNCLSRLARTGTLFRPMFSLTSPS